MAIRTFASVSGGMQECEAIPQDKEVLRQTLRSQIKDIFPWLDLISHDYRVGVADFNTLAYDANREKFVIVEYMRSENGLASRVIEYDDELKKKKHQGTTLKLYADKFDTNKASARWPGAYVIAISDHFSDRDKELARKGKFSLPTELHIVSTHRTYMMEIESIDDVHEEKSDTILSKPETRPVRLGRPAKGTMRFFLSGRSKEVRSLGLALDAELTKMKLTPNIPNSNQYARFTLGSRRICVIKALKDRIRLIYSIPKDTSIKESDFVYSIKNSRQGRYASDIMTSADINRALQIVKDICNDKKILESPKVSKTDGPQIHDTVHNGASKIPAQKQKSKTKKRNQKPTTTNPEFEFSINGRKFQENSAIGTVKKIVEYLAGHDDQFLERIEDMKHSKTRRYIARDKNMLYPKAPHLIRYSFEIPTAPGWYLGTNYSKLHLKKIAALVKEAADPKIRDTMTGDIFELYNPKRTKPSPQDAKPAADSGDEIPYYEDIANEFKSSFVYDYKVAEFESQGNQQAVVKQRQTVAKNNFGFGLEWDVAKAIAGFSNSYLEEGRIWVGVKENKGGPPTILGLEHDFQKARAKNSQDDFTNWINSLIGNCIRDYKGFHNFDLSFLQVSGKQICLLKVTKSSKPMMLVERQHPDHTIFYLRNKIAPRTDRLQGLELVTYMNERFPNQHI